MRRVRSELPHRCRAAVVRGCTALMLLGFLAGCASVIGELPAAVGGLPEGTPERAETPIAYPAVHDMPPQRTESVLMTDAEQRKAAADLAAARDAQAKRAAAAAAGDR